MDRREFVKVGLGIGIVVIAIRTGHLEIEGCGEFNCLADIMNKEREMQMRNANDGHYGE